MVVFGNGELVFYELLEDLPHGEGVVEHLGLQEYYLGLLGLKDIAQHGVGIAHLLAVDRAHEARDARIAPDAHGGEPRRGKAVAQKHRVEGVVGFGEEAISA